MKKIAWCVSALAAVSCVAFAFGGPPSRGREAMPESADGKVMGRDFSTLMSNPFLDLTIERGDGEVVFIWRAESKARLDEIEELGRYMAAAKQAIEQRKIYDVPPPAATTAQQGTR